MPAPDGVPVQRDQEVLAPRNPPLTDGDLQQTAKNPKGGPHDRLPRNHHRQRNSPASPGRSRTKGCPLPAVTPILTATATIAGVLAVVVGVWGGIAPYIGHAIRYSADGSATWTWNVQNGLLSLLPGAMAAVGGLLLTATSGARRERASVLHIFGLTGPPCSSA